MVAMGRAVYDDAGRGARFELWRVEEADCGGVEGHHGTGAARRDRGATPGAPAGQKSRAEPEPGQYADRLPGDDKWPDRYLSGGDGHDSEHDSQGTSVVGRSEPGGARPQ